MKRKSCLILVLFSVIFFNGCWGEVDPIPQRTIKFIVAPEPDPHAACTYDVTESVFIESEANSSNGGLNVFFMTASVQGEGFEIDVPAGSKLYGKVKMKTSTCKECCLTKCGDNKRGRAVYEFHFGDDGGAYTKMYEYAHFIGCTECGCTY